MAQREDLAKAISEAERAESLLRPIVAAHEKLRDALRDSSDWLGTRDPADTAEELLRALRRVHLPGSKHVESAALALAQSVGHAQAVGAGVTP